MFDLTFDTYTVKSLTDHIAALIKGDTLLSDVWVEGEISNCRASANGHCYFTLKDANSQLSSVLFKRSAERQGFTPRDGEAVLAHGYIEVYGARGQYQLIVDRVRPVGIGDLYQRLEETTQRLAGEGLFDRENKRPLPAYPHRLGIVTSPDAAAYQDVQNVLRRRWPLLSVVLSPTLVQGDLAPLQIVRALERLNARDDIDLILICRGGGSIEDLWAFNDERVARAIAASRVPTIVGVGHETDTTLADHAADVRAPTPSAAAELLTPNRDDARMGLNMRRAALDATLRQSLSERADAVQQAERSLRRLSPVSQISIQRQRIDDISERLQRAQRSRLALLRERLAGRSASLAAADPHSLLRRGYALVRDNSTGAPISHSRQAPPPGTGITITFADGEIAARIEEKTDLDRYARTLF